MVDELRRLDLTSRFFRAKSNIFEKTKRELASKLGYSPSSLELAEEFGLSLEDYFKFELKASPKKHISLYRKRNDEIDIRETRALELICNYKSEDPTKRIKNKDILKILTRGLNKKERLIIIQYYYENKSMEEIGDSIGLSESRVSQMHTSIMSRIKDRINGKGDEFYNGKY